MKKEKRRSLAARVICVILAVLFVFSVVGIALFTSYAADAVPKYSLEELSSSSFEGNIPFLCIRISFDVDGDGEDDWDPYNPTELYNESSPLYGEQWIHSPASYWTEMLFGEKGKTLLNFYKEMTDDSFWFSKGWESQGEIDDGVVDVVVNMAHPRTKLSSFTTDGGERRAAILAAEEYVDFKSYDKDGDGFVSYTELAILFVVAGYEYSYNTSRRPSSMAAFGTHAHYTSASGINVDGVTVLAAGYSGYVKAGEYQTSSQPIGVGVCAHEFGHFLGAADLYDSSNKWTQYVGSMSLMASGSHTHASSELSGSTPTYFDPMHSIMLGFEKEQTVIDGEYTLYSRESEKGDYNIVRVNTPNPDEYYLIENRYSTSKSLFDNTLVGSEGIVVWHIDESIVNGGKINVSNQGHDPGVVVLGPTSINASNCAFEFKETSTVKSTFIANNSKYKFPISGTWYTGFDDAAFKNFNLRVDVLSAAGSEMKIRVSGAVMSPPTVEMDKRRAVVSTESSLELFGRISNLNGGNVTSCGMIISKDKNPTEENGTVAYVKPADDGTFSVKFEGLEQGTKYYYKVFAEGKYGMGEKIYSTYTSFPKREDVEYDYFNVYLHLNYNNNSRRTTIYVYPDQPIRYQVKVDWAGYRFCGWYWDAEYNNRYDMDYTQSEKDNFSLYGKWVRDESAMRLNLVGASVIYNFYAEIGDTYPVPTVEARDGYEFMGWYTDEKLTQEFDFGSAVTDEQITLYAKWRSESGEETGEYTKDTTGTTATEPTVIPTSEPTGTCETPSSDNTANTEEPAGGCSSVIASAAAVTLLSVVICGACVFIKKES